ncbi:MAG: MoaD/ThiS family protein [Chthoniobacteraceae bacterium]
MIQVKLLAFAHAAVELGWREMLVECAPTDTPRELFGRLAPGFDAGRARIAVDCEYRSWDDAIGLTAHELAVIPPVSGG